jgi:hypothetical protein
MFIGDAQKPKLGSKQLLIRVKAAGLNRYSFCIEIKSFNDSVLRADIQQREGKYPPPPGESDIIGLEVY